MEVEIVVEVWRFTRMEILISVLPISYVLERIELLIRGNIN